MKKHTKFLIIPAIWLLISCQPKAENWEFHYPGDLFTEDALLDLRYLNENFAGEHGFIGLSSDGESFVREDGEAIRFWPVNGGSATRRMNDEELAWHARFLAKQGVNMNRWHGSLNPAGKETDIFELDTAEAKAVWRWVAAMKKEGIYSTISPFWAHNGHMGGWVPEEWGIEGYKNNDALWEVMYFNDRLKEAYKTWVKYLYTENNPYTGIALKDEAAVALIQIKNEDGVFFWTMQSIKPELKTLVGELFADWLITKYGSLEKTMEAWQGESLPGDDLQNGCMDLYLVWEMTQEQTGPKALRLADETEFYAHRQRQFYDEIHDFYRDELGCKQLVNPNNWRTADPARLNDLERWTYMGCEVPAVNRYYAPGHRGENNGWRIDPGHFYQGISCLKKPAKLPINNKQTAGSPMLVTESGWNLPHKYQSEAPALIAAYQSLTGHDAFYWFSLTSMAYFDFPYFEFTRDSAGMYAMNRWTYSTPGGIAQFPAYALLFRMGYISEGETMVHEVRALEDMWKRTLPLISEEASFDPNRDQLEGLSTVSTPGNIHPLAFLTGPVKATYGGDPKETFISDKLDGLIDLEQGKVSSITGELNLDYHKGIFTFDTPKAAGVSGFLAQEKQIKLTDISLVTKNDYITVGVVSMDGLPLKESQKLLVQTGTAYRPSDWQEEGTEYVADKDTLIGFTILNTGKMPWLAEPTRVEIQINNALLNKAYILDAAGYKLEEVAVNNSGNSCSFSLPANALYTVLVKE